MTARTIRIWPDPCLLTVSTPIEKVDASVKELVQDLIDSMEVAGNAAGLAAPQIGINKRVFVANIPPEQNDGNGTDGYEAFINPEFIKKEGQFEWEEGCMSIPGERGKVKRAYKITMRFMDINGQMQEREAFDYLSGCLQHEADHLDGKLWIDYQSAMKKDMVRKKMQKLRESL